MKNSFEEILNKHNADEYGQWYVYTYKEESRLNYFYEGKLRDILVDILNNVPTYGKFPTIQKLEFIKI